MYQSQLTRRDRAATFTAVALIHLSLAFVLINISPEARRQLPEEVVDLLSVTEPPPPPIVQLEEQDEQAQPERKEGAASARNIESRATPVVAPEPRFELPKLQPTPATQTPNQGTQPTQGASDVAGSGTGAGGTGTGTGSGAGGTGSGGGGSGGVAVRPVIVRGLTRSDYPDEVARYWPRRGIVAVAVRVLPNGRATECKINRSIGVPAIDQWTCRLLEQRAVFRPARDASGRPVASWYGYIQE